MVSVVDGEGSVGGGGEDADVLAGERFADLELLSLEVDGVWVGYFADLIFIRVVHWWD